MKTGKGTGTGEGAAADPGFCALMVLRLKDSVKLGTLVRFMGAQNADEHHTDTLMSCGYFFRATRILPELDRTRFCKLNPWPTIKQDDGKQR